MLHIFVSDIAVTKNTSVPPLWSPEADRTHSVSQHTATSSKKPAFNLSAFGTLSPVSTNEIWSSHIHFECLLLMIYHCVSVQSLGNSSVLKTSQLGDSPFYPGKTVYGGAAAARQPRLRSTPYQVGLNRRRAVDGKKKFCLVIMAPKWSLVWLFFGKMIELWITNIVFI